MKKEKIGLFFFIDAFGWEILQNHPNFLEELAPHRQKLETILGYSSACDPSIISGKTPSEHLHWSSFYYSPKTAPYKWIKHFWWLPDHHRIRHQVSKIIKKVHGITGYFQVYQFPFQYLPYFDYAEKKRIWEKGGLLKGETIFDHLTDKNVPYYVGDQDSEKNQIEKTHHSIEEQSIEMAYLLFGKLDATMHAHGTKHPKVTQCLKEYEQTIRELVEHAKKKYNEVEFFIFSDHGMHDVKESYDLQEEIKKTGLQFGVDYIAVYDSTMARFWYLKPEAEQIIIDCLKNIPQGRVVPDSELKQLGVYFPDGMYGKTIFLMNSHILIIPSFMGLKTIPGMHGYHPSDPDSAALILSNQKKCTQITRIEQIYRFLEPYAKN